MAGQKGGSWQENMASKMMEKHNVKARVSEGAIWNGPVGFEEKAR